MTTDRFREFADDDLAFDAGANSAGAEVKDPETVSNVHRLPRTRWRSLGEHLDYTHWPERDRFIELDRKIAIDCPSKPMQLSRTSKSLSPLWKQPPGGRTLVRRIGGSPASNRVTA